MLTRPRYGSITVLPGYGTHPDRLQLREESERLIKEAKEAREAVENEAANNRGEERLELTKQLVDNLAGIEEEAERLREAARASLQVR